MKIKVSNATPLQLDWLVAHSAELVVIQVKNGHTYVPKYPTIGGQRFTPTTDWSQGGPIIEREKIWLKFPYTVEGPVEAVHGAFGFPNIVNAFGPTPLIAAMRCLCCAKLGGEVDVPEELCQQQNS